MPKTELYITPEVHASFKLNGITYTNEELKVISSSLCKNGAVYEQEIGQFFKDWLDDKSYIVVKTSGSTGVPKSLKLDKEKMIHSALATGKFFKMPEDSTALLCLSVNYIAGKMMLIRAMTLGWRLDVVPYRSNPLDTVYKCYDFCAMVPMQLDNSLNRLHLIKKLIVGGGSVSEKLQRLVASVDTKIYETYGMTETVSHIAARRLNPKKKKKKEAKAFKALPDITLAVDERSCLIIKAPKLTSEVLVTNDVVELLTYKRFQWKGRYDNVVNSGGIKLHPELIEKKLLQYISSRFFVKGTPDNVLGERLVLVIEGEGSEEIKDALKLALSHDSALSKYELPKMIYFLPKFIETPTGKIQRTATLESCLQ